VEIRLRFSLNKDWPRLPPIDEGVFREFGNPPPCGIAASGRVGRRGRGDGRTLLGRPSGRVGRSCRQPPADAASRLAVPAPNRRQPLVAARREWRANPRPARGVLTCLLSINYGRASAAESLLFRGRTRLCSGSWRWACSKARSLRSSASPPWA